MSVQPKRRITPEEYLAAERQAETKSEYYNGEVFALAGASRRHNLIVSNLIFALMSQTRGRTCEVYPGDLRVKVEPSGLYTYPNVGVVCGQPQLEDNHLDTLLNPTVLIEVLSPSTERYDRSWKAGHYMRLESLQELLFVAQDQPLVQLHRRQNERDWLFTPISRLEDSVDLTSIECQVTLGDIYYNVLPAP